MRGGIGRRLSYHPIGAAAAIKSPLIPYPASPLSSFSGDGDGSGRGRGRPIGELQGVPKKTMFSREEQVADVEGNQDKTDVGLPSSMRGGIGRGKTTSSTEPLGEGERIHEVNRHLHSAKGRSVSVGAGSTATPFAAPMMSHEDAVNKAVEILSGMGRGKGGPGIEGGGGRGFEDSGERGFEGRGGHGGRRGRGGRGGRGRGLGSIDYQEEWRDPVTGVYRGDPAVNKENVKKLAKLLGQEQFDQLMENIHAAERRHVMTKHDYDSTNQLDYELRCFFDQESVGIDDIDNPNIHDSPPLPIEDYLQSMRQFIMLYDDMTYQQWETLLKELKDGLYQQIKKIVKPYAGPMRVDVSKQKKMLKGYVKQIPEMAPPSVESFANRCVTALHNNPGWKFDNKREFMEMLVKFTSDFYSRKQ